MIYKSVFISKKRYQTILINFLNKNRVKKSNYKFDIYQDDQNNFILCHQYNMPQFKCLTKDTKVQIVINKQNRLNILYATSSRQKISQEFNIIQ